MNGLYVGLRLCTLPLMTTHKRTSDTAGASNRLVDIPETQRRLDLSRTKVIELIDSGALTGVHIGTARRVVESSIDDYIDALIDGES